MSCRPAQRPTIFQFTPLREGRRNSTVHRKVLRLISIHAPPRGATASTAARGSWYPISIHAPPRGATPIFQRQVRKRGYFNSRPSARGDMCASRLFRKRQISIHAPPRGATRTRSSDSARSATFQFTPLREGRRWGRWAADCCGRYFNSRPSARGDHRRCDERLEANLISIHAPPRGATWQGLPNVITSTGISIHAPPRGATSHP